MTTALELLKDARDIVAHPDWWRKGALCDGGSVCAMGALGVAAGYFQKIEPKKGPASFRPTELAVDRYMERVGYVSTGDGVYVEPGYEDETETYISPDTLLGEYDIGDLTAFLEDTKNDKQVVAATLALAKAINSPACNTSEPTFDRAQECVIDFNDAEDTAQKNVVAAFDRAIRALEGK